MVCLHLIFFCEMLIWLVWGPSPIPFADGYPMPKEMTEEHMDYVEKAWVAAAERCQKVGCKLYTISVVV